jgi:hypothetical protein
MFENGVLRRIFGPKRGGVAGDWRKLHSEELHNLHALPNTVRIRWAGNAACMEMKNVYKILVGTSDGKKTLGRLMRTQEDNIKMDVSEIMWQDVD